MVVWRGRNCGRDGDEVMGLKKDGTGVKKEGTGDKNLTRMGIK